MSDAQDAFEVWRSATGEERDEKLRALVRALRVYAQRIVYAKLKEERPDIVAEAVWRAISKVPEFRGDSKFSTWFHRIVLNLINDALRKKQQQSPEKAIDDLTQEEVRQLGAELDFVSSIAIRELLEGLSESDVQMVHMRYEGLTWQEIAGLLGITHEAARLRWAHVRARILRNLAKRGKDGLPGVSETDVGTPPRGAGHIRKSSAG